jgi:molybdopterin converting factor small subunit
LQVTLKLFASLSSCLPAGAQRNKVELEIGDDVSIWSLLDSHNVPRDKCHLVLLNGIFKAPEERDTVKLQEGDVLAVWPPVAGG